jgi:hypothetical protein
VAANCKENRVRTQELWLDRVNSGAKGEEMKMDLKWLLERQIAWISHADSKLSVLGPLPLAMLAISLANVSIDFDNIGGLDLPLAASSLLLCVSLFFSKAALSPRLQGPPESLVFFGRISEYSNDEFVEKIESLTDEAYRRDIIQQIHINAKIASQKHKNIAISIFWLTCATPLWLLAIALEF